MLEISKEELYKIYIEENNTMEYIAKLFNCSRNSVILKCKEFKIKKDKQAISKSKEENYFKTYGVKNPSQSPEVKRKKERTCMEHFGVANPFQSEIIKSKMKQTNLERYGVEHPLQSEMIKSKFKYTCLNTFGAEYPIQTKAIQEKQAHTCLDRFGVEHPAQAQKVKDKIVKTNMEKYNVPYYVLTTNCSLKGNNSKPNKVFEEELKRNGIEFEREFAIGNFRFDFKIGNILIEINPIATHNSTWGPFDGKPKDKLYHYNKTKLAIENGYHCIHVWDWDDINKIIYNFLLNKERVYARKCKVKLVSKEEEKNFLNTYHFQGYAPSQVALGLYYEDKLVEIMTFGKPRYNKHYEWELIRLCSAKSVIGGSEKLLKHFKEEYKPTSIVSYCDMSKFDGKVYENLGFTKKIKDVRPSRHWYNPKTKQHITDNFLRQRGFDQLFGNKFGCFGKGTDNNELMRQIGFVELYDSGQATYIYNLKD